MPIIEKRYKLLMENPEFTRLVKDYLNAKNGVTADKVREKFKELHPELCDRNITFQSVGTVGGSSYIEVSKKWEFIVGEVNG